MLEFRGTGPLFPITALNNNPALKANLTARYPVVDGTNLGDITNVGQASLAAMAQTILGGVIALQQIGTPSVPPPNDAPSQ
jgi:hypothetical protein